MSTMKRSIILIFFLFIRSLCPGQQEIRLLVRGDDIGSAHAANLACIDAYQKGILRSVEIMVPCSWFEEAVVMLNQHPGLDVGIHLVLTSEWNNYKWRPLTHCPSITDDEGYFYPMIWPSENYPENRCLVHAPWKIEEVEAELRAQIELALKKIPHISHLSHHMGWTSIGPEFKELFARLEKDYHLEIDLRGQEIKWLGDYDKKGTTKAQTGDFVENLKKMTPGTYVFVEHPAYDHPEMEGINHIGYENVGKDRENVTRILTSPKVKRKIEKMNIRLISYKEL
jgi:hypothetical protein